MDFANAAGLFRILAATCGFGWFGLFWVFWSSLDWFGLA